MIILYLNRMDRTSLSRQIILVLGIFANFWIYIFAAEKRSALVADVKSDRITSRIDGVNAFSEEGFLQEDGDGDPLDVWRIWLEESNNDITGSIRKALATPAWWRSWELLHSTTRDAVVTRLRPHLIERSDWTLHCSNAYKLCQSDSNCRWKYWNYVLSCTSADQRLAGWDMTSKWNSYFIASLADRGREARSVRNKIARSGRRIGPRRKNRRRRRKGRRNLLARRRSRRNKKKQDWVKATNRLHYWMGKQWRNIYENQFKPEKCSSQCLNALLMLNKTVYGTLLGRCDCKLKNFPSNESAKDKDDNWNSVACKQHQAKAQECRPRLFKPRNGRIGCTASRVKCENEPTCKKAQKNFLLKCSQMISGVSCTPGCVKAMGALEGASRHFNTCVCDGVESPVCHKIRTYMKDLCTEERDCSTNQEWTSDGQVIMTNRNCAIKNDAILAASPAHESMHNGAFDPKNNLFFLKELILLGIIIFPTVVLT